MASSDWAGAGCTDVSADTCFAPLDKQQTSAVCERACNRSAENALEDTRAVLRCKQTQMQANPQSNCNRHTEWGWVGLEGCVMMSDLISHKSVAAVSGWKHDRVARWRTNQISWWRRRSRWCSGGCCFKFYWSQIFYLRAGRNGKPNFLFNIHIKMKVAQNKECCECKLSCAAFLLSLPVCNQAITLNTAFQEDCEVIRASVKPGQCHATFIMRCTLNFWLVLKRTSLTASPYTPWSSLCTTQKKVFTSLQRQWNSKQRFFYQKITVLEWLSGFKWPWLACHLQQSSKQPTGLFGTVQLLPI